MGPECRHIKTSGGKCGSPALRGQPYCYFHARLRERAARSPLPYEALQLPPLEDRASIQVAISDVVQALAGHTLDPKRAGMILYALQIASSNAQRGEEIVSSYAVSEVTHSDEGEEMAPEGAVAGPPQEPTLADLIVAEIRWGREQEKSGSDSSTQLPQNEDFETHPRGEGVSAGAAGLVGSEGFEPPTSCL